MISGDSYPFCKVVAQALCDRFDRILLIEVNAFHQFIYSALGHNKASDEHSIQLHRISIEGAVATAAAANSARFGVIIVDELHTEKMIDNYRTSFAKHGIREVQMVSLLSAEHDNNPRATISKSATLRYSSSEEYLRVADLVQDLVGKNMTAISLD